MALCTVSRYFAQIMICILYYIMSLYVILLLSCIRYISLDIFYIIRCTRTIGYFIDFGLYDWTYGCILYNLL